MSISAANRDSMGSIAAWEGVKYGLTALAVTSAATFAATKKFSQFNKLLSVSAKVSMPLMASLGIASYRFETVAYDVQLNPEKWGIGRNGKAVVAPQSTMPIHHKIINSLYDHPFRVIAGLGVPFASYIIHEQYKLKHMKLSQRLMHSRVMAQFGVISILLGTMAFKSYMDEHGRFPEPGVVTKK